MDDKRVWVPVEVIWDEDLWKEDPWRGDRRERGSRPTEMRRPRPEYDWSQGWQPEVEEIVEEEWGDPRQFRQDGAGLSKRKRKKLRSRERDERR